MRPSPVHGLSSVPVPALLRMQHLHGLSAGLSTGLSALADLNGLGLGGLPVGLSLHGLGALGLHIRGPNPPPSHDTARQCAEKGTVMT